MFYVNLNFYFKRYFFNNFNFIYNLIILIVNLHNLCYNIYPFKVDLYTMVLLGKLT